MKDYRALRIPRAPSAVVGVLLMLSVCQRWADTGTVRAQGSAAGDSVPVELSTVGLDGRTGLPIVVLRDPESGSVLPIWVGSAEAQAIALALHGVVPPRPMTHDLMANLISELRAEVDEVVVTDLRNNTYFGIVRLRVAGDKKIRDVDSRPSDALALALRTGAQIRVARKILAIAPEFDFIAPEGPNQVVQALGMTVVVATPSLRKEFRLGTQQGVVVTSAFGPAREKGVRRGDLIIEVNGKAIDLPSEFFAAVRAVPPRGQVRITAWRDGEKRTIELPADVPPSKPGGRGRLTAQVILADPTWTG
jgi:bifunctional DNase/RNase